MNEWHIAKSPVRCLLIIVTLNDTPPYQRSEEDEEGGNVAKREIDLL